MQEQSEPLYTNRSLLNLIVPLMITVSMGLVVGMIDSVMVAGVGEAAVSGVSLVDSVVQLIIYVFSAMASGGAIVAGQYLGNRDGKTAKKAAGELVWLNAAIGLVMLAVMIFVSDWMVRHLFGKIEPQVYHYAGRYMTAVQFSLPAIAVFESGNAIFRTMNDAKTPMKISFLMNGVNVVGNYVLINVFSLDTLGVAIASVLSRWLAAVIVLVLLLNPQRELSVARTLHHRFDAAMIRKILRMGIPNGIENGFFQFGKIAILGLVTAFGTAAITANAVTQTMAGIEVIPGLAVQQAALAVIARCVGMGDYAQAKAYNRKLLTVSYVCVAVFSAVLLVVLPLVLRAYHLSDETAALATTMFRWHTVGAVLLWPAAFVVPASLRAAGDVKFPMFIAILSMWVLRFGGAYVLAYAFHMGAVGAWIAMSILDWGFRTLVFLIRWHNGKWQRMRIVSDAAQQGR